MTDIKDEDLTPHRRTKLEVLEGSLKKKEAILDQKIEAYIKDVKSANGQPLNDKKGGHKTMARWDKKNEVARTQKRSVEKTEDAIEYEKGLILGVSRANEDLPEEILELVKSGVLTQWRKHPTTFFVVGVEKGRMYWDLKKGILSYKYYREIPDLEQRKLFAEVYNKLKQQLNPKD